MNLLLYLFTASDHSILFFYCREKTNKLPFFIVLDPHSLIWDGNLCSRWLRPLEPVVLPKAPAVSQLQERFSRGRLWGGFSLQAGCWGCAWPRKQSRVQGAMKIRDKASHWVSGNGERTRATGYQWWFAKAKGFHHCLPDSVHSQLFLLNINTKCQKSFTLIN